MNKKLIKNYLLPLIIFLVVDFGVAINFKELLIDAPVVGIIIMFVILIAAHVGIIYHALQYYKRLKSK